MAETTDTSSTQGSSARASTSGASKSDNKGRLETERGTTTIAEVVVTKVAGIAAREVGGVHRLGGAVARALGGVTQRLGVGESATQGVSVEVTDSDAVVAMNVIIDYGESIPDVAQAIRENVIRRIEGTTGLHVSKVDVTVTDLYFPGDDDDDDSSGASS